MKILHTIWFIRHQFSLLRILTPQFQEQSNLFHSNRRKTEENPFEENPFLLLPISGFQVSDPFLLLPISGFQVSDLLAGTTD
ncbi:hypothetical protein ACJIZ3_006153 [Penstemon smallii]|uniref:Uncharacterized protein n=1 Tax=Penstemon smallii TaxID=265156 RepID=A0ABD3S709_9LAMI